jgi:hypothetical protein
MSHTRVPASFERWLRSTTRSWHEQRRQNAGKNCRDNVHPARSAIRGRDGSKLIADLVEANFTASVAPKRNRFR